MLYPILCHSLCGSGDSKYFSTFKLFYSTLKTQNTDKHHIILLHLWLYLLVVVVDGSLTRRTDSCPSLCGSEEDREGKREEERREVKEEEKRRTSIIIFLCVHVGIAYVLCVNWNNLMLCVTLEKYPDFLYQVSKRKGYWKVTCQSHGCHLS